MKTELENVLSALKAVDDMLDFSLNGTSDEQARDDASAEISKLLCALSRTLDDDLFRTDPLMRTLKLFSRQAAKQCERLLVGIENSGDWDHLYEVAGTAVWAVSITGAAMKAWIPEGTGAATFFSDDWCSCSET